MDVSRVRSAFLELINQARCRPQMTADNIYKTLSPLYHEDELHCFHKTIDTFEGMGALQDLRNNLKRLKGVDSLTPSDALCRIAQRIAEEKGTTGRTDHDPPQVLYEKISTIAHVEGSIGELIALKANSGEEVATYFMLDDGLASRKRRRMLLDPKYKFIGVGNASHRQYQTIMVVLLTQSVGQLHNSYAQSSYHGGNQSYIQPPQMQDMGHSNANFRSTHPPDYNQY